MEQEIIYITRAIENWKAEDREIELMFEETITDNKGISFNRLRLYSNRIIKYKQVKFRREFFVLVPLNNKNWIGGASTLKNESVRETRGRERNKYA